MGPANIWHFINIYGKKVTFLFIFLIISASAVAQIKNKGKEINNPNYDNRFISYGFLLGIHTSNYKLEYSDAFANPESPVSKEYGLESIHSVLPKWTTGFTLGFIVNFKFFDLMDARLTPQVTFYEHHLDYRYVINRNSGSPGNPIQVEQVIESTLVEFPVLVKFKSERRGNTRAYLIGGLKPAIEVSGKNQIESGNEILDVREGNISIEMGFGLDIYFPLFKFSPEIRYSRGITNMHRPLNNEFSASLSELNTNTITLYLLFQ